ncbi:MAG TPA: dihydrolipoamide acetyltransferase family protein [Steroidobacteraceae bacterium]|nr:dihydrolipoamide acetyltransferase family protein [Steroidobacteraceae bacterium]
MTRYVFKMPDLGEGTVEAELVAWHVKVGDLVEEDQIMAEVMTDKAAVEVPAPVKGRVLAVNAAPGDMVPVGSELVVFETDSGEEPAAGAAEPEQAPAAVAAPPAATTMAQRPEPPAEASPPASTLRSGEISPTADQRGRPGRIMASPATRRRAREAGVDLAAVRGSGPGGRITRQDFEAALKGQSAPAAAAGPGPAAPARRTGTEEIKIIGVRRLIATRMSEAKRNIPHFSYVEEVDVTELESLRAHLNEDLPAGAASLTYLPFIAAALCRVLEDFPQCNALHDAERGMLVRHQAVHLGIATQTPEGLKVPVVRHAEARSLWDLAAEIRRVSEAARGGKASREELTGSTITITSLGRLGGIVSTPIINAPEMGIIGVNKAVERPVVINGVVAVRRIMNLSSSFDHRFVDGYDAAAMVQALRQKLEHPATIFIPR